MSEPSVPVLVRELAQETHGWLEAEAVRLRYDLENRIQVVVKRAIWVASGLVVLSLGLQALLTAVVVSLASGWGLGVAVSAGLVGGVLAVVGIFLVLAARGVS